MHPSTAEIAVELYRAGLRFIGHDAKAVAGELAGILVDSVYAVEFVRARMSQTSLDVSPATESTRLAGTTAAERLDLCNWLVTEPPERGDLVVWLLYDNASMSEIVLEVGPVAFFDARWVLATLDHGDVEREGFPSELRSEDAAYGFKGLDRERMAVLVRVELRRQLVSEAERVAGANAEALVEVARFRRRRRSVRRWWKTSYDS